LSRRHISLETALAEAKGVPIQCIELRSPEVTPIWDYGEHRELIQIGYEIASLKISDWIADNQAKLAPNYLISEQQPSWKPL